MNFFIQIDVPEKRRKKGGGGFPTFETTHVCLPELPTAAAAPTRGHAIKTALETKSRDIFAAHLDGDIVAAHQFT